MELKNPTVRSKDQKLWLLEVYGVSIGASFRFRDISAVSTLILTHEQFLERELDNLRNDIGLKPFR